MSHRSDRLDEKQERKLLEIESKGFWIAYWGVLAVLLINVLFIAEPMAVVSTFSLLIVLSVYQVGACIKAGIWDRKLDIGNTTSVLISVTAAVITGVFVSIFVSMHNITTSVALASGATVMAVTFFLCYIALRVASQAVIDRQNGVFPELEEQDEEDEIDDDDIEESRSVQ